MKNKIRELLNKNVTQDEYGNYILDAYPSDIENLVNELLEAINYTHSCESDSEQLLAYTKFLRDELHLNISDTWVESYVKNSK